MHTCDAKSSRVNAAVSVDLTAARYGLKTFDYLIQIPNIVNVQAISCEKQSIRTIAIKVSGRRE